MIHYNIYITYINANEMKTGVLHSFLGIRMTLNYVTSAYTAHLVISVMLYQLRIVYLYLDQDIVYNFFVVRD